MRPREVRLRAAARRPGPRGGQRHRPCAAHAGPYARQRFPPRHRQAPRRRALVRADRRHAVRRRHRPTRPCRSRARDGRHSCYDTLQPKLLPLPDDIEIFPGHQAGSVCGAGLSGKPSSTMGFERRWNPALVIATEDEFVALTRQANPAAAREHGPDRRRRTSRPERTR